MKKLLGATIAVSFLLTACSETTSTTKENKSEAAEQVATNELTKKNIKFIVQKAIGPKSETSNKIKEVKIKENGDVGIKIYNKKPSSEGLTQKDFTDILQGLEKVEGLREVRVMFYADVVDSYGRKGTNHYALAAFSKKTRQKINFEEFFFADVPKIADQYVYRK